MVTSQLKEARNQIWSLEEELAQTKELLAIQANMGHTERTMRVEPKTIQEKAPKKERESVDSMTHVNEHEWEKEINSNTQGRIGRASNITRKR